MLPSIVIRSQFAPQIIISSGRSSGGAVPAEPGAGQQGSVGCSSVRVRRRTVRCPLVLLPAAPSQRSCPQPPLGVCLQPVALPGQYFCLFPVKSHCCSGPASLFTVDLKQPSPERCWARELSGSSVPRGTNPGSAGQRQVSKETLLICNSTSSRGRRRC